jgi:hypothetical protein
LSIERGRKFAFDVCEDEEEKLFALEEIRADDEFRMKSVITLCSNPAFHGKRKPTEVMQT